MTPCQTCQKETARFVQYIPGDRLLVCSRDCAARAIAEAGVSVAVDLHPIVEDEPVEDDDSGEQTCLNDSLRQWCAKLIGLKCIFRA